ncbi:MAG: sulfite exporter TauE/SafE family protein [Colwellia sp.]|nr:sulfite exporter TauE/SafE family protein [Colwellia sp.]
MFIIIIAALLIGLSLGILGSGGAILTIPVLIYGLDQSEIIAITSSLVIVGTISLVTVIVNLAKKQINWSMVLLFGLPSMMATYMGAWLGSYTEQWVQMLVFSLVMMIAAWRMAKAKELVNTLSIDPMKSVFLGGIVGILTGFVGVGGGFIIVPALMTFGRLKMSAAVATSLMIISLNSVVGFLKYQQLLIDIEQTLDWQIIGLISVIGSIGSLIGQKISTKLPQQKIRQLFALMLLLMSSFILLQTLYQFH